MYFEVLGDPHSWPRGGKVPTTACAIVVVDMQNDYCSPGYYIDHAGSDTKRLSEPVDRIQRVLKLARIKGINIFYTQHGRLDITHKSEVSIPSSPKTAARGEIGWQIVQGLTPETADTIIEKTTCSAFASSDLDSILRSKGITHLAFWGNTIDVCVHPTLRSVRLQKRYPVSPDANSTTSH